MNKKLVYICNSLDRLKLLDKLNFKDRFNGELYIVSDDRYMTSYIDIKNFIDNEATNINLKESKQVLLKRDIFPVVLKDLDKKYQTIFTKLLFACTTLAHLYFTRSEEDLTFVVEDDCVLFKNPESIMTGLRCSRSFKYPPNVQQPIQNFFYLFGPGIFEKMGVKSGPTFMDEYKEKYGKILSQATTCWTYQPDFLQWFSKWLDLPQTIKNINYNINHNCKLWHRGFAGMSEEFMAAYLIYKDTDYFNDNEITTQARENKITNAKDIADGKVIGYHYTIINDEYVNELLPILVSKGYIEYLKCHKEYKYNKHSKFVYLDDQYKQGWTENIHLKIKQEEKETVKKLF